MHCLTKITQQAIQDLLCNELALVPVWDAAAASSMLSMWIWHIIRELCELRHGFQPKLSEIVEYHQGDFPI
jgi:hypothetical protein